MLPHQVAVHKFTEISRLASNSFRAPAYTRFQSEYHEASMNSHPHETSKFPCSRPGRRLIFVSALAMAGISSAFGQEGSLACLDQTAELPSADCAAASVVSSTLNPLQLALLRWYNANLTTKFPAGSAPFGIAFDGFSMWVSDNATNTVTRLRASDGLKLGSFSVGTNPTNVLFDGANIWVANFGSNNVTKLRAADGTVLGTFPTGAGPSGVVFDGQNIWVTNFNAGSVTKLLASSGATLGTFTAGSEPQSAAFDGANIWVTNFGGTTVSKM